jgi:hypothetical protein
MSIWPVIGESPLAHSLGLGRQQQLATFQFEARRMLVRAQQGELGEGYEKKATGAEIL